MSLVITIVKFPDGVANTKASHTFSEHGGTLGRAPDNQWVLEDPERFISGSHSEVVFDNGQYFLVDLSTNGTFMNGSGEPIGKGNRMPFNDGDRFSLGDYEFQVNLFGAGGMGADPFGQDFGADPFATSADPFATDSIADPFASPMGGHVPSSDPLSMGAIEETDPLAALDKAGQSFGSNNQYTPAFPEDTHSDQASFMHEAVDWPTATVESGGIPENWDDDVTAPGAVANMAPVAAPVQKPKPSRPAPAPQAGPSSFINDIADQVENSQSMEYALEDVAEQINRLESEKYTLEKQNLKLQEEIVRLKQPGAHSVTAMDHILIEAMGLADRKLSKKKVAEISQIAGAIIRESMVGMMQVLSSRNSIKNEFRMNVTTIQPIENNPLKFSANLDDALENMFLKEGNAYMHPLDAMREGFDGIGEHQLAILAGIRAAFKSVIQKFDPAILEHRFEKFQKGNFIPGMSKMRNWELYSTYYQDLVSDLDSSFQNLFGHEFVNAYEEQLQQLAMSRKVR